MFVANRASTMCKIIVVIVLLAIFVTNGGAYAANTGSGKKDVLLNSECAQAESEKYDNWDDFYLFPYHTCALFTIKDVQTRKQKYKDDYDTLITAQIENVLRRDLDESVSRGDLKEGCTVVFRVSKPVAELWPDKRRNELTGTQCLWAFNSFSPTANNEIPLGDICAPLKKDRLTNENVQSLKEKLKSREIACLPNCIRVKILAATETEYTGVEVKADVEEVLYGEFAKTGVTNFSFEEGKRLLTSAPINQLVGKECLWEFSDVRSEKGKYFLYPLKSLFRDQSLLHDDLEQLRSRNSSAAAAYSLLKAKMQKYLESRWTIERIEDYCRPELVHLNSYQGLVPDGDVSLGGTLHAGTGVGNVEWCGKANGGIPNAYQVSNVRDGRFWILEASLVKMSDWSDEDFLKHRLKSTLYNCLSAYLEAHLRSVGKTLYAERNARNQFLVSAKNSPEDEILSYNTAKMPIASTVRSTNGHEVCVKLDANRSITDILIDGKPDNFWFKAYKEAPTNIENANARFR